MEFTNTTMQGTINQNVADQNVQPIPVSQTAPNVQATQVIPEVQASNIGFDISVPTEANDVIPINYQQALASYTEAERQEIIALADSIDVKQLEKVMSYGSTALKRTFDQCGNFLKDERGSHADQEVISRVIELSKKASNSYDDFNLVLQEPGLFQQLIMKLTGGAKSKSRTEKVQKSAVTNYKLLIELKKSCDQWLEMLKKAMGDIEEAAMSDVDNIGLLEKYIIAGHIAESRIAGLLEDVHAQHEQTGLQKYAQEYKELKEGSDIFAITMTNLEKSRVMYYLSIGQLSLIGKSNRNVQISIHTQVNNSMALFGQQLRNALLNAKTQEVLEGQNAIIRLSDELIKDVSQTVGLTAEQTEKALYASFYSTEAAKTAVTTVINSCNAIQKTASEMLPKMKADLSELEGLIQELEPVVGKVVEKNALDTEKGVVTSVSNTGLQF